MADKNFLSIINANVDVKVLKEHADGSKYIPISVIQSQLDEIFNGNWSWNMEREMYFAKNVGGGMGGKGILTYQHPETKDWLIRSGTAAIGMSGDFRLDFPRLEAMCLLNAAKKIGIAFGRNLNRDKEDVEPGVIDLAYDRERDLAIDALNESKNSKELVKNYNKYQKFHSDQAFNRAMGVVNKKFTLNSVDKLKADEK